MIKSKPLQLWDLWYPQAGATASHLLAANWQPTDGNPDPSRESSNTSRLLANQKGHRSVRAITRR